MVIDPISNFVNGIKNANIAGKETVEFYNSKIKEAIARALLKEGFIKEISKKKKSNKIEITLAYTEGNTSRVTDVQRISKQSKRVYESYKDIRPFLNGFGRTFFSTPKGILTDKEARKERVGGEVLFKIW
ncbi:MAG: 30S ribosomal protein S8 [Minisyncoccia bacterium]